MLTLEELRAVKPTEIIYCIRRLSDFDVLEASCVKSYGVLQVYGNRMSVADVLAGDPAAAEHYECRLIAVGDFGMFLYRLRNKQIEFVPFDADETLPYLTMWRPEAQELLNNLAKK